MTFISLTRLRIRSVRFLPAFAWHAIRSRSQASHATGFQAGSLLPDRHWTFWTITAWDTKQSMLAYRNSAAHLEAMPRLLHWCDEASVAHWEQPSPTLPTWAEADRRMRETGRLSKVQHPSPRHASSTPAALDYDPPRTTGGGSITPA